MPYRFPHVPTPQEPQSMFKTTKMSRAENKLSDVMYFAYLVTESTVDEVKVGQVQLYRVNQGTSHTELIVDKEWNTFSYSLVYIGRCWVVDGKVQFEKPPLKSGLLTQRIMGRVEPDKEYGAALMKQQREAIELLEEKYQRCMNELRIAQALAERRRGGYPIKEDDILDLAKELGVDLANKPNPIRQYKCRCSPNCSKWFDEGTGPFSKLTEEIDKEIGLKETRHQWRDKPSTTEKV